MDAEEYLNAILWTSTSQHVVGFTQIPTFEKAWRILETGIKVVDLLAPYAKGGKIGLFGGAGVGKTVLIMELINNMIEGS